MIRKLLPARQSLGKQLLTIRRKAIIWLAGDMPLMLNMTHDLRPSGNIRLSAGENALFHQCKFLATPEGIWALSAAVRPMNKKDARL